MAVFSMFSLDGVNRPLSPSDLLETVAASGDGVVAAVVTNDSELERIMVSYSPPGNVAFVDSFCSFMRVLHQWGRSD